jgi:excisionase family DNA binding protein
LSELTPDRRTAPDRRRRRRGGRRITDLASHDQAHLTLEQLATYFAVERLKWIRAGALRAYRLGERAWRVRRSDAAAFERRSLFRPKP